MAILEQIQGLAENYGFTLGKEITDEGGHAYTLTRAFPSHDRHIVTSTTENLYRALKKNFDGVLLRQPSTFKDIPTGGSSAIISFLINPKRQSGVYLVVYRHNPDIAHYNSGAGQWYVYTQGVVKSEHFQWISKQPLDLEGLVPAPYEYRKTGWYKCVTTSDEKVINYWCADKKCWSFTPRLINSQNWDDGMYESINEHAVGWG